MNLFTIKLLTHGKTEYEWNGYAEDEVRALAKALDAQRRQSWCSLEVLPNRLFGKPVNTIEIVRCTKEK
jgi:hypothetical protein